MRCFTNPNVINSHSCCLRTVQLPCSCAILQNFDYNFLLSMTLMKFVIAQSASPVMR